MKKMKPGSPRPQLQFRIVEVKKLSYFQNDHVNLGLSTSDIAKGLVNISPHLESDINKSILSVFLKVVFFTKKQDVTFELFGIETLHRFQIKDFQKKIIVSKDDAIQIPDDLVLTFLNVSISGTRGMLVALNANPAYASIILPILSPKELLDRLKVISSST